MKLSAHLAYRLCLAILLGIVVATPGAWGQVAGTNVNMVSGTQWPTGDPFLQRQNEPSMAVSTRNPMHILAGANDYRTVDLETLLKGGTETGDAWLGLFKSFDGGLTWQSTLLPGCPETVPQCTDNNGTFGMPALQGIYGAGSDPVVRAGTNGMFYYAGLVFVRPQGGALPGTSSAIFVARYNDLNNNERIDPIAYIDTRTIASATVNGGQFLDKPAMAVDIPRAGAHNCSVTANEPGATDANGNPLSVSQSFPAGNVYVAYTEFLDATKANATPTNLMFTHSTDCGATWSTPVIINKGTVTSQGSAIAVNPVNGNVYVTWRQFASTGVSNAIMVAQSTNAGKTFSAPVQISTFQPFDQGTTGTSFRTNAYPSITTDMFGFVYVAFSARGLGPNGDARVVAAGSIDGTHWTPAIMVDNPKQNSQNNPSGRGHQIMPAITFANGRLTMLYYDLRFDHYVNFYTPGSTHGTYIPTLTPEGELGATPANTSAVFTPYVDDAGLTLRRHTIDLRVLQLGIFPTITLGPSVSVTQYAYGCCVNPLAPDIEQFQFNVPNLPLFAQGSEPFLGDYIEVVPSPMFVPNGSGWSYNFTPSVNPLFHATWTDNRDVKPPANGDWTDYTPPIIAGTSGQTSVFGPNNNAPLPVCKPGQEGMRNQNVYTAQITGGLVVGAPGNAKPLGTTVFKGQTVPFQRAFAVEAQDVTNQQIFVRFTIANQPTGGTASFLQFSKLTTLDVTIPAFSSVSRSVFVTSTNPQASITVNVAQISAIGGSVVSNGLSASTVLNPDITNPNIGNPNIGNPNIGNTEVTDPNIGNTDVTTPNIGNPNIGNPDVNNPNIGNPNIGNPNIGNPNIANVSPANISVTTPNIGNPNIANPNIGNPNIGNPNIGNPNIGNPNIANGAIEDDIYPMTNTGNTTASYNVQVAATGTPPGGVVVQLILNKLYQTPIADNCQLGVQTHWVTVANIIKPTLYTPDPLHPNTSIPPGLGTPNIANSNPTEGSVTLAPGETVYVTLRVQNNTSTPYNPVASLAPVTIPHAVDTQTVLSNPGNTGLIGPVVYPQLTITTAVLPATDQGDPGYSVQLQSMGGKPGADTWSITALSQSLTGIISISSSGLLSASSQLTPAPNSITVLVKDSAVPPNTASKTFSIPVNFQFTTGPLGQINDAVVGQPYIAIPFNPPVGTGTAPITWTATGLPNGLSISQSGQISGSPLAGTTNITGYAVQVKATDSAVPPVQLSRSINIRVADPLVLQQTSPLTGTLGVSYSTSLATFVSGGIGPYVFSPSQTPGVLLDSNGQLTITNPQLPTMIISVSVHDQANPTQSATFNFTITFTVTAGQNVQFLTQPPNYIGGQTSPNSPIHIHVQDNQGASIANAAVTMSLNGTPPCSTAILSGTVTQSTDQGGDIFFNDLNVDRGQMGYALRATVANTTLFGVSNPFTVNGFCGTAQLLQGLQDHTATLLGDGTVLVTGGQDDGGPSASGQAEIYTPGAAPTFALTNGGMHSPRLGHTATLLPDGTVLIVGGIDGLGHVLNTAEIYTPGTGLFTLLTATLNNARSFHTATLLADRTVLIAGGDSGAPMASAEIYDPIAQTFTSVGSLTQARELHTATMLSNGKVLIAGGLVIPLDVSLATTSAEVYDPVSQTFGATGAMFTARRNHAATLLANGEVLITGGLQSDGVTPIATAEVYNPFITTGVFALPIPMNAARGHHTASLLTDGTVLVVGGIGTGAGDTSAEVYDLTSNLFTTTGSMITARYGHSATLLNDGSVLVAGGSGTSTFMKSAEVYYSTSPLAALQVAPSLPVFGSAAPFPVEAQPYTRLLAEIGGVGPLNWTVASGLLPPGVNLMSSSGILIGTPTSSGSFTFTVHLNDSSNPPKSATSGTLGTIIRPQPPTNASNGPVTATSAGIIWEFSLSSDVVGYNVYRSSISGGPYTLLAPGLPSGASSYTDSTVVHGNNYFYVVTAIGNGNVQSVNSDEVPVSFP
jgi:hypothetical protein